MKFRILLVLAIAAISYSADAQDYKSAIGLRLGYPLSVSYKTFINDKGAIELTAGYRSWTYYNWFNFGAYYQHHMAIKSVDNLSWYIGGGANAYVWSFDNDYYPNNDFSSFSLGISGVIGLDYKFANIPLNISLDWIPTFFVNGFGDGFGGGYGGVAVRYVLK